MKISFLLHFIKQLQLKSPCVSLSPPSSLSTFVLSGCISVSTPVSLSLFLFLPHFLPPVFLPRFSSLPEHRSGLRCVSPSHGGGSGPWRFGWISQPNDQKDKLYSPSLHANKSLQKHRRDDSRGLHQVCTFLDFLVIKLHKTHGDYWLKDDRLALEERSAWGDF